MGVTRTYYTGVPCRVCGTLCRVRSGRTRDEVARRHRCPECRRARPERLDEIPGGTRVAERVIAGRRVCGLCPQPLGALNPGPICHACEHRISRELARIHATRHDT